MKFFTAAAAALSSTLFALSAADDSSTNYYLRVTPGRMAPPFPTPQDRLAISWATGDMIIGPDTRGFPVNFEPYPTGVVKSLYYPGSGLSLSPSAQYPGQLWDLKWKWSAPTDKFTATTCTCGNFCSGDCLLPQNNAGGHYVVKTVRDNAAGGYKVQWWNGTQSPPAGSNLQFAFVWRNAWTS